MKIISILMVCLCLSSCSAINKFVGLEDDNFIEEALEDVVQHESGLNLDFTPENKEE